MKVKTLHSIFVGSTVKAGMILDIDEDTYKAFGEEYFEMVETTEGNDKDGNSSRTENPPKSGGRSARSKT